MYKRQFPGITAAIVDETGTDVPNGHGGILVIKKPWPSMIRTIWGDPDRFVKSYYPPELKGYYPVSYTHLDVYKRQVQANMAKPEWRVEMVVTAAL